MSEKVTEREFVSVHFDEKIRRGYIVWKDKDGNVIRVASINAQRIGKMPKGWKVEDYTDNIPTIADGSVTVEYKVKTTKVRV